MKKILFSLFLVLALVAVASPAFALQCKEGNYGSDECWTSVKVSASETTPVIAGTVLMYDFASSTGPDDSAFQVRVSSASTDVYKVAGVAQGPISTGDRGMILVRGQGQLQVANSATSGDRLYTSSTAGKAGTIGGDNITTSHDGMIAFALETSVSATIDAYIVVV